ncbi:pyruvate dehydrogenase [Ascobolus immersus RN42]|uniref:Acetyltransferase component of pyruvate dehydrogenase complex n=1 Tax=Ascobolus immersus RN42 TaxID=1160509 RepID=A0A3N4HRT7_ASCIM|nr:pyruvate dehydrogenase [Ascobolus immersus RN42]
MTVASLFTRAAARSATKSTVGKSILGSTVVTPSTIARPQLYASLLQRYYASKSYPSHTLITMPALSPTMTAGNIGTWQKSVGDTIAPGDVLVEIETDKAQMDFEYQEDGVLAKILLESGEKDVAVGSPIAVLVEEGEDISAFSDFTVEDAGGAKSAPKKEEPKDKSEKETPAQVEKPAESESSEGTEKAASYADQTGKGPLESSLAREGRIFVSPLARRIASEKGIPLEKVKGTGENGRITKADVEAYKGGPSTGSGAPAAPAAAAQAAFTDIPLTGMRRTIAKRLAESKNTNPHYYVSSQLSVSKLLKLRAALNASAKSGEYKLSVNDFLVKAVASALLKVPAVNSAWLESEGVIRQYSAADISVAVATPTGLMTPIVKGASSRGLQSISAEIKALAQKAKDGKLKPEEYQGGTFTISNLGMNDAVERFTAIINPPQAAILAVGTTQKVAVPGEDGGIEWDDKCTVTASFDHRVIDGAVGGEFMKALKEIVEDPLKLLL